jgi:hypothetical protein
MKSNHQKTLIEINIFMIILGFVYDQLGWTFTSDYLQHLCQKDDFF